MSPLRDRRFVALLAGQAVNGIGSWCALIAIWGYAAYKFDANPAQIALLSFSWALPAALLGPLAGIPVDRFGPKRALIAADTFGAVIALALAFSSSYWQLVALGACVGVTRSVSEPAFTALAPRLVGDDQLLRANALLGAASMSAIAFGPLIAAGAISLWGIRAAFLVDAVTYLIGNAVVVPLHLRAVKRAESPERPSVLHELRAGFAVVRDRAAVRRILGLSVTVYMVWGAYAVIEPLYVRDVLHRSPATLALLQAAFGVLLLANALLVARVGDRAASMRTLRIAALLSAAAAPFYVGTTWVAAAFCGVAVWGAGTAWLIAPRDTLLQRATPVETHGRVLAIDSALRSWAHVIALPLAALAVTVTNVRVTGFLFALLPLLGVLLTRTRPTEEPQVASGVADGQFVYP
jgi:predicted MFS family arabinose efflux permease